MLQRIVIALVAPIYHANTIGHSKAAILEGWIINHPAIWPLVGRLPVGRTADRPSVSWHAYIPILLCLKVS
jgi:hypothetical protein